MTSHFDDILDGVGFMRSDVLPLLASAGVLIDEKAMPSRSGRPPHPAEERADLRPFVPRVNITLGEAASLLDEANGGHWWATLEDAVDSGKIQAETWGFDRSEQPLSHADIRAWCEAGGIIWPVPLPPGSIPATDEGLREALAAAHAKCAALESELSTIKAGQSCADWHRHNTRIFKLLPAVIELARSYDTWPKQETWIGELKTKFSLTKTEAEAIDTITRPDELRKKRLLPPG